jgi:hypothetical protein
VRSFADKLGRVVPCSGHRWPAVPIFHFHATEAVFGVMRNEVTIHLAHDIVVLRAGEGGDPGAPATVQGEVKLELAAQASIKDIA